VGIRWCCKGFEEAFRRAGLRGHAVFSDADVETDPKFVLQFRAIDSGAEPPESDEVPVSLVSEAVIEFCPWCGRRLKKWYRGDAGDLSRPDLRIPLE
jgi:hypothetical protein